jgi:general secretion pathway protein G
MLGVGSTFRSVFVGLAGAFAILFLLASLAWFCIGPSKEKRDRIQASCAVGLLRDAVKSYNESVGRLPPDLGALFVAPAGLPPGKWHGPYLDMGLSVDPWGHPYQYLMPGRRNADGFDIWTVSPDGEEIGNW